MARHRRRPRTAAMTSSSSANFAKPGFMSRPGSSVPAVFGWRMTIAGSIFARTTVPRSVTCRSPFVPACTRSWSRSTAKRTGRCARRVSAKASTRRPFVGGRPSSVDRRSRCAGQNPSAGDAEPPNHSRPQFEHLDQANLAFPLLAEGGQKDRETMRTEKSPPLRRGCSLHARQRVTVVDDPFWPLIARSIAAVRLHQAGHLSVEQQFEGSKVGRAGQSSHPVGRSASSSRSHESRASVSAWLPRRAPR